MVASLSLNFSPIQFSPFSNPSSVLLSSLSFLFFLFYISRGYGNFSFSFLFFFSPVAFIPSPHLSSYPAFFPYLSCDFQSFSSVLLSSLFISLRQLSLLSFLLTSLSFPVYFLRLSALLFTFLPIRRTRWSGPQGVTPFLFSAWSLTVSVTVEVTMTLHQVIASRFVNKQRLH